MGWLSRPGDKMEANHLCNTLSINLTWVQFRRVMLKFIYVAVGRNQVVFSSLFLSNQRPELRQIYDEFGEKWSLFIFLKDDEIFHLTFVFRLCWWFFSPLLRFFFFHFLTEQIEIPSDFCWELKTLHRILFIWNTLLFCWNAVGCALFIWLETALYLKLLMFSKIVTASDVILNVTVGMERNPEVLIKQGNL